MKKWLFTILALGLAGGGYLAGAHLNGGAWPLPPGMALGGDRGELREIAMTFWEDIQFKDFDKAATYHAPELQDAVDIPFLIERLFAVKPELLELQEYEVVYAELDSSGTRARVKCRMKVQELGRNRVREQEMILYFYRDEAGAPWFMKLEDSLRAAEADKDKKHR